jgi:hypothetical protein
LVPAGRIALVAEQVNRDRLRPAQALGLRYAGLLLVYLSSTADLFLTGLGRGVQLPIALALLSVAGVLLGTLLRVRAFLLLRCRSCPWAPSPRPGPPPWAGRRPGPGGRRASCSARRS